MLIRQFLDVLRSTPNQSISIKDNHNTNEEWIKLVSGNTIHYRSIRTDYSSVIDVGGVSIDSGFFIDADQYIDLSPYLENETTIAIAISGSSQKLILEKFVK